MEGVAGVKHKDGALFLDLPVERLDEGAWKETDGPVLSGDWNEVKKKIRFSLDGEPFPEDGSAGLALWSLISGEDFKADQLRIDLPPRCRFDDYLTAVAMFRVLGCKAIIGKK